MGSWEKKVLRARDLLEQPGGPLSQGELFETLVNIVIDHNKGHQQVTIDIEDVLGRILRLQSCDRAIKCVDSLELYNSLCLPNGDDRLRETINSNYEFQGSLEDVSRINNIIERNLVVDTFFTRAEISEKLLYLTYQESYEKLIQSLSMVDMVTSLNNESNDTPYEYIRGKDLKGNYGMWFLSNDGYGQIVDDFMPQWNKFHLTTSGRTLVSGLVQPNVHGGPYRSVLVEISSDESVYDYAQSIDDLPGSCAVYDAPGIVGEGGVIVMSTYANYEGPIYSIGADRTVTKLANDGSTMSIYTDNDNNRITFLVKRCTPDYLGDCIEVTDGMTGERLLYNEKSLLFCDAEGNEIDRAPCTDMLEFGQSGDYDIFCTTMQLKRMYMGMRMFVEDEE